ncbi:hypothetical protein [Nocardia gipuzkoensis]
MTGIPTQLAIADLVRDARRAAGQSTPAESDLPFYYLGAVGAKLGDFLPARTELGASEPNSRVFAAWLPILGELAGTPGSPGLYANLKTIRDRLSWFRELTKQADIPAKLELIANRDKLEELNSIIEKLSDQLATVAGFRTAFADAVQHIGGSATAPASSRWKNLPTQRWRARDTLHCSHTGRFLQELRRRADASGDSQLRAYADGAMVAYASQLSGNPFINNIVGGPRRNHWWRHQWISNYVDTWVWGYVEKRRKVRAAGDEIVFTDSGQVPNPVLPTWDNVCGAGLQKRITFGGINENAVLGAIASATPLPAFLPAKLVTLWLDSYTAAYGPPAPELGIDAAGLQSAFAQTWMTLWLGTSADFLGSHPSDQINPPDSCGPRPDWVAVDGSVVLPGGTVVQPPTPAEGNVSALETASAIAAAILAIINYAYGNVAAGNALIVSAVALLDEATPPDWDALSCHADWVAIFLANLENALHDLLVTAGLVPPYTVQLEHNSIQLSPMGGGNLVPPTAALATCRTTRNDADWGYPRSVWSPSALDLSNWTQDPTEPSEDPGQVSYTAFDAWPSHFVDGWEFIDNGKKAVPRYASTQTNPLAMRNNTALVLSGEEWEERSRHAANAAVIESGFGNAVDLARSLLDADAAATFLDWDLDADRGIGWPTWIWGGPSAAAGDVEPEP